MSEMPDDVQQKLARSRLTYDKEVLASIKADQQQHANNAKALNLTDKVNEVTEGGRFVLGPIDHKYVMKMKERWWGPFAMVYTLEKGNPVKHKDPQLTDDEYRAAVEISQAYQHETSDVCLKTFDPLKVTGNAWDEPSLRMLDLIRKRKWWLEAIRKDRHIQKHGAETLRDMIEGDVTINDMRKKTGKHADTLKELIRRGLALYVEMFFHSPKRKIHKA